MLHVEEVLLECPTDWKQLLQGDPPISRVTLRRPTWRATRLPGGGWSTAKLLPPPVLGKHPPEVICENGVIEICDPRKATASPLTLRDINLALIPDAGQVGNLSQVKRLRGTLSGDGFRRVEIEHLPEETTGHVRTLTA